MQVNSSLEPPLFSYQEFVAFTGPQVPAFKTSTETVGSNDSAPEPGTWVLMGSGVVAWGGEKTIGHRCTQMNTDKN
jgi:hypothetical protein